MKGIFLNRLFLTGLNAYLNQLDLSVDRALQQDIAVLRTYCAGTNPTLTQVLAKFDSISTICPINRSVQVVPTFLVPPRGRLVTLAAWLSWYLRGGVVLKVSEMQSIHTTLLQLSAALNECRYVDPQVFVPIRLRLTYLSILCAQCIPDRSILKKIGHVEHLNQNPILKTMSMDAICNHRDWLNSGLT